MTAAATSAADLAERTERLGAVVDCAAAELGPEADAWAVAFAVARRIAAAGDAERGELLGAALALAVEARMRSREHYR